MPRASLLNSLAWSSLDALGTLLVGLGSVLLVARLVGPAEFGLGALAVGLLLLAMLPTGSLVHDAIVQRPEVTAPELDAAFTLSVLASAAASLLVAAAAVPLAGLLAEPRLAGVVWAMLPALLFGGVSAPLVAERRRAMEFAAVGRHQLAARAAGLAVGVGAALAGGGVWAVVAQQLASSGLLAGGLLARAPRAPRWHPSPAAVRPLLAFSHRIVWTQVLGQATDRLFMFAVGYAGGAVAAGHWGAASRIVESLTGIVNASVYHVALAHFSRLQRERRALAGALLAGQDLLALGVVPVLAALAGSVEPLLRLAMGEEWLPAAPVVLWLLLGALATAHGLLPGVALTALGRPGAGLAASAATGAASLSGLLGLAAVGCLLPGTVAIVRGLAPLAGWWRLATGSARELTHEAAATHLGRLLLDLLAVASALACARLVVTGLPALPNGASDLLLQAGVTGVLAFAAVAVARPRAAGVLLAQYRRWRPVAPPREA